MPITYQTNGHCYTIDTHTYPQANWGLANFDDRTVTIHEDCRGKSELDTLIHEVRHTTHPDENESEVEAFAKFWTDILYEYGYRKAGDDAGV